MKTFFSVLWLSLFVIILCFTINCFYGYFYPIKYKESINFYAKENNIEAPLIASIINVESSYRKNQISSKGALGLMQIIPSTGEWIANKMGEVFEKDNLLDAETNIKYGSFYVSYLVDYFQDVDLAICAYNAGMGNVKNWISNEEYYENGKLKNIPFNETKKYLEKVTKNLRYYKNKY